jgi:hypothetical protein
MYGLCNLVLSVDGCALFVEIGPKKTSKLPERIDFTLAEYEL